MAASSVTGTGPGESFGKQKPELHSGCGCGQPSKPAPATPRRPSVCKARYSVASSVVRYSSSASVRINACT